MTHISDFGLHLHFVFCGLYNPMWLFDCKITNRFSLFIGDLDFSQYTITYSSKYPNLIASFDKIVITFAHKIPIDGIKQEIVKDHEWIKRHTSILQYENRNEHTIVKQMFRHSRVYKWFVFLDIERRVGKIFLHIIHHNRVLHRSGDSSHQGIELKITEVITKRKAPPHNWWNFSYLNNVMVNQRVSEWNSCKQDMTELYLRLVDLGMEYSNGEVYLVDLDN